MYDKFSKTALLLDFYGNLLTDKQRLIMSYHFEEDMSLSEISEELNISRQAVHDLIKRSGKLLSEYESKLGLIERFLTQKDKLRQIKEMLTIKKNDFNITTIINMLDELIDM